jgi:CRP/FNR family transcriptional regulator, cyclic AMP receptor protein
VGLRLLAGRGQAFAFGRGEEIVSHKDTTDNVFILLAGLARVIVYSVGGQAVRFGIIRPGCLFGEFSAIDGLPRSASVEAVEPCRVLRLPAGTFWRAMESEPALMRRVVRHLVARNRALTERVYEFSTLAVKNRIQAELLRLAGECSSASGEIVISPIPRHGEIAERVSTQREAVAREMSKLAELGILQRRGQDLVIKDLPRLQQMVRDAAGE